MRCLYQVLSQVDQHDHHFLVSSFMNLKCFFVCDLVKVIRLVKFCHPILVFLLVLKVSLLYKSFELAYSKPLCFLKVEIFVFILRILTLIKTSSLMVLTLGIVYKDDWSLLNLMIQNQTNHQNLISWSNTFWIPNDQ